VGERQVEMDNLMGVTVVSVILSGLN
jgi:hypothetical protein